MRASRSTFRVLFAATSVFLLAACSDDTPTSAVTVPRFTATVVFGASLDDTGNVCNLSPASCPPAPYFNGRVSNGPLWVELLAANYGTTVTPSRTGGTNYAHTGARTRPIAGTTQGVPSMTLQVEDYLAKPTSGSRAKVLFVLNVATVGNDINDALTQSVTNPQAPASILGGAVLNTMNMIGRLYANGAQNILLVNSVNVGQTPLVRALGAEASAGATQLSTQFNSGLNGQLAALRASMPLLNLYVLDAGALHAAVIANPTGLGFANSTLPCLTSAPSAVCSTPERFFFWDGFHPTAAAGRLVFQRAVEVLDAGISPR
jgi:phospholipase/lecithinase/hemolysin